MKNITKESALTFALCIDNELVKAYIRANAVEKDSILPLINKKVMRALRGSDVDVYRTLNMIRTAMNEACVL